MDTAPAHLASWIACAAFTLVAINQGIKFFHGVRGDDPSPPNASLGLAVATLKEDFKRLEGDVGVLRSQMQGMPLSIEQSASKRSAGIYERIDSVRIELSDKMDTMQKNFTDRFDRLSERLK